VKRLEHLREERAARRERSGNVKLAIGEGQRSGKLVAELSKVSKSFGERTVVNDLDLILSRGDRIGLVGSNGAGKTTLLRLILGGLAPDSGHVRLGANVQPAYFDQMREALDPEKTVADTISPGSEWVDLPSGRKHIMSYLGDFLFSPRRAGSKVAMLSGGERNRLLLARLFAKPANVLVLDEPTNDLDIESLELLEVALQDYAGTILLVSHDRAFLDNVVTSTFVFKGGGRVQEYVGGYADWLRQRPPLAAPPEAPREPVERAPRARTAPKKLSYHEQRELDELPARIEALEVEQRALGTTIADPGFYKQPASTITAALERTQAIEHELIDLYARWDALDSRSPSARGAD
jgi:ATP-binding cassette subfamily F protein uup